MNGYELSRIWFDWCFENPEKISPNHSAIYFFAIEHCNRLGWRKKFGFPTEMVKDAIGIKSYNTYIKTLNDLVDWGFIEMIERSKNQYSANIVALVNFDKALDKALDKAIKKHASKQDESTIQSIDSINKQLTIKPINKETIDNRKLKFSDTLKPFLDIYGKDLLNDFFKYWTEPNKSGTKFRQELEKTWDVSRRLETWLKNDKNFTNGKPANTTATAKPKFRKVFSNLANQHEQAENGNTEGELFEDTEYTEVE